MRIQTVTENSAELCNGVLCRHNGNSCNAICNPETTHIFATLRCSRVQGHSGAHIACGFEHNMRI